MKTSKINLIKNSAAACLGAALAFPLPVSAQTIAPYYAASYNLRKLGTVPGLPTPCGGMVFKAGDSSTLLIGGNAETQDGKIYQIALVRNASHHITGFSGSATYYADAYGLPDTDGGIDAGLVYGPGNVLLYTSYQDNSIGQIKPGQHTVAKLTDLSPLGVGGSVGGLVIVPSGLPGAGRLKILSYNDSTWYDTTLSANGSGTFNIAPVSKSIDFSSLVRLEGGAYVAAGNPRFPNPSVLLSDYDNDRIVALQVDANGDPVLSTLRNFVNDFLSPLSVTVDPLTGDFLLNNWGDSELWVVGGFGIAPPTVTITSPANNSTFAAPADLTVSANASQTGGAIQQVDFYLDGVWFGQDKIGVPYSANIDAIPAGIHALTAVAIGSGLSTTSSVVHITVTDIAPTVAIVSPAANTAKNECADWLLTAEAISGSGSVTNLAYYLNTTALLGSATQPPYPLVVSLSAGTYNLTVVASDDLGINSTSAPVRIVVVPTPTNALSASLLTSGEVRFCFRGLVSSNYVFEHSYTLDQSAVWTPFFTNRAPSSHNGLMVVAGPYYAQIHEKYYRARRVP